MSLLDIVLAVATLAFAVHGFRQGFIVGALSFAGFVAGGIFGIVISPKVIGYFEPGLGQALVAIAIVLGLATIGQLLAAVVGAWIRDFLTWHPVRLLDAGAGALLGAVSLLVVSWFVGSAVATAGIPTLTAEVRASRILAGVDRMMPADAKSLYKQLSQVLDASGFPQVFAPFDNERISPVEPPDPAVINSEAVRAARSSIVKVLGEADSCNRQIEGTGFVYAPQRVMTNAHVVAGVRDPVVQRGGSELDARVIVFDPDRDVAVLYVPDLRARPLPWDFEGSRNDDAVVAGFPRNGPFRADPAKIREEIQANGPDIYDQGQVQREVFSLHARVEPGNSGGPLLAPDGDVYGVIFAKSLEDPSTGYALTADEVRSDAAAGRARTGRVDTGACT